MPWAKLPTYEGVSSRLAGLTPWKFALSLVGAAEVIKGIIMYSKMVVKASAAKGELPNQGGGEVAAAGFSIGNVDELREEVEFLQ